MKIEMVDLKNQYKKIKSEIDDSILKCITDAEFINGNAVKEFQRNLESYLGVNHVIPCANGTDALQIALMALDLRPGDEIICPAFTYIATVEVIGLLKLKPVLVDVNPYTFNLDVTSFRNAITNKTKAVVPVHLYGQACDMEEILQIANNHNIYIKEDNAQSLGAKYTFSNERVAMTGTMGQIGCTSFFPSKNLGCYGDGGALMTNDEALAKKIKMISNHGQEQKYYHKILGCNSRLDTIQAEVLKVKLKYLDEYNTKRNELASFYDSMLGKIDGLRIPVRSTTSTHVFHQYTLFVNNKKRDSFKEYLGKLGIPSMIYYPLPVYKQDAFKEYVSPDYKIENVELLCESVISLPMHTEMNIEQMHFICNSISAFFNQ